MAAVLQAREDDVVAMMGVPCSTFITVSRGSTSRCPFLPMGSPLAPSVYRANKLLSRQGPSSEETIALNPFTWGFPKTCYRSLLVCMVILAIGGAVVIEQPHSSILTGHRAFKHLNHLLSKLKIPATRDCKADLSL